MATLDRSMKMASRLAAATALTGTLAACDAIGVPTDALTNPFGTETASESARKSPRPAAPGNPVYIGGSQATNDALYQQTYGAPLEGSGQEIAAQPTFAESVYQDRSISSAPVLDIPGGPAIDAGNLSTAPLLPQSSAPNSALSPSSSALPLSSVPTFEPAPVYSPEAIVSSQSIPVPQQVATLAPLPIATQAVTPVPVTESAPLYNSQSTLLPTQVFTDASTEAPRDIESLLDASPENSTPYGSTASHRYSAPEAPLQTLAVTPQYSLPVEVAASEGLDSSTYTIPAPTAPVTTVSSIEPLATTVVQPVYEPQAIAAAPLEPVQVASLGDAYIPMPTPRPARIGPVFEQVTETATPAPAVEVASLGPIPNLRPPVQLASLSGQAITDAPALTEPPVMIEVEPVFLNEPEVNAPKVEAPTIETAALAPPVEAPKKPIIDAPTIKVEKPEAPKQPEAPKVSVASLAPKITTPKAVKPKAIEPKAIQPAVEKPKAAAPAAPRVEIAPDVGDLKELSGTSWRLSKLNGEIVPASAELHFDGGSGFAGGQGICNNYGGEFSETLKGDFDMSNIFSTETDCEHFRLEKSYIVALESASSYRMAPGLGELMLVGPDGKTIANFEAF